MKKTEQAIVDLQKKGYKRTKNREAILDIIYTAEKPLSALDILEELSRKGLKPNKTTVYRKLDILKNEHLIREVMIDSTTTFYERSEMNHHHHLICINCKMVTDFHPEKELEASIQEEEEQLFKKDGFKTIQHSFEFFGYCKKCVADM
jgi:Fur family ferric uptake transcriptional regulator